MFNRPPIQLAQLHRSEVCPNSPDNISFLQSLANLGANRLFPTYFNLYISLPANRKAPDPYS